jgi:hypothetical protein
MIFIPFPDHSEVQQTHTGAMTAHGLLHPLQTIHKTALTISACFLTASLPLHENFLLL